MGAPQVSGNELAQPELSQETLSPINQHRENPLATGHTWDTGKAKGKTSGPPGFAPLFFKL
jgi:hypothetical protein